ncbi:hypothetical protein Dimus_007217 [Dionaea muscipula]
MGKNENDGRRLDRQQMMMGSLWFLNHCLCKREHLLNKASQISNVNKSFTVQVTSSAGAMESFEAKGPHCEKFYAFKELAKITEVFTSVEVSPICGGLATVEVSPAVGLAAFESRFTVEVSLLLRSRLLWRSRLSVESLLLLRSRLLWKSHLLLRSRLLWRSRTAVEVSLLWRSRCMWRSRLLLWRSHCTVEVSLLLRSTLLWRSRTVESLCCGGLTTVEVSLCCGGLAYLWRSHTVEVSLCCGGLALLLRSHLCESRCEVSLYCGGLASLVEVSLSVEVLPALLRFRCLLRSHFYC